MPDRRLDSSPGAASPPGAASTVAEASGSGWTITEVQRIEDLQDAVHGAGLDAIQYSSGTLSGSLAVTECADATFTLAQVGSRIGIRGPLHRERITIGLGLGQTEGSKQWMRDVRTGTVGIFLPGEEHHGLHAAGSSYVAFALSRERLEETASELDLILDPTLLGSSGLHPRRLPDEQVMELVRAFGVARGASPDAAAPRDSCRRAVQLALTHLSRPPRGDLLRGPQRGYARIVDRAQDYVMGHLEGPIRVEDMARAAHTSVRSLHRAFGEVLGESPASYVRRVRLHRIRYGLLTEKEALCSVTRVAYRNGIRQLGRMARFYRDVFGELPSQTLAHRPGAESVTSEG